MRQRLLQIITDDGQGGAQSHVETLVACALPEYETHVACGGEGVGALSRAVRSAGCTVHPVASLIQPVNLTRDRHAISALRKIIRSVRPDLVHLHSSKAGVLGRIAARQEAVPAVFTAHGWAFAEGVGLARKMIAVPAEWMAARFGGHIITVSQYDAELARRYRICRDDRLTVVRNGLPDIGHERATHMAAGEPHITMVARFSPQKDHETLIRAFAMIPKAIMWRASLVGDGPTRCAMQQMVNCLNLGDRVQLIGARDDIPRVLASSSVFVLASHYEGFPISIIEAMRAGLPVIATNVGGVSEAVLHEKTGYLVGRRSVQELSDALLRLVENPSLRGAFGAAGRERYSSEFTDAAMWLRIRGVYRRALGAAGQTNSGA
jgi:glycosyltransferase involved in cell wall biosynthesis